MSTANLHVSRTVLTETSIFTRATLFRSAGWSAIKLPTSQKNDTDLACYNFDVHQLTMKISGRNVIMLPR